MTDMSRRDQTPEQMVLEVVDGALGDAGVDVDDLALVVVGNAGGGRLSDQGCIRGQAWLRKSSLGNVPIINVDNSCAGGVSALHVGSHAAVAEDRPVLVVGVEKMWTGEPPSRPSKLGYQPITGPICTLGSLSGATPPGASSWV